ncbi:MAG TPA: hypothetical protein VHC20_05015 [Candidatus Paceibacterota bacterium]|nr:hypothetical protein [Candidatus Paceibacterota bacterium]
MIEFIEQLRAKPHHIRHRIAVGTATGIAGVITLAWVAVVVASHPFSGAQFYAGAPGSNTIAAVEQSKNSFASLLGAVGAAGGQDSAPGITVVTTQSSSTVSTSSPTVLPF